MTKTKKAVKELNKTADKAILKAQLDAFKSKAKKWLDVEVYGFKRGKILLAFIVVVAAIISTF
jgi:hypothetical protein